jgi:D-threonate/D-erythronate kinase
VARIGLVADDLTGACDSALPFLGAGPVRVGIWPHIPKDHAICAAVSTESRASSPVVSRRRSASAARRLAPEAILFRKLDSMLRGNPLADLEGVLQVTEGTCLVAPALPAEGRVTVAAVQHWPGGEADLRLLLRPLGERLRLCDAGSDEDLLAIARGAVARGDRLLAGTAGLAAALAAALALPDPPAPAGLKCSRPLAVVGSRAARSQATFAVERGWQVKILTLGELPVVDSHDGLVLTGGETAARVLKAHGARGLELVGQALPRTPACRVRGGRLDGLPVVLKAGAFGESDALHRALEVLSGRAA